MPPSAPPPSAPQCPSGLLDQVLALIAQVLGGAGPERALADGGAHLDTAEISRLLLTPETGDAMAEGALLLPLTATDGGRVEGDSGRVR